MQFARSLDGQIAGWSTTDAGMDNREFAGRGRLRGCDSARTDSGCSTTPWAGEVQPPCRFSRSGSRPWPAPILAGGLDPQTPRVLTREEFFARPNYWYYLGGAPIPDQWIAEAWDQLPEFRENVTYEFEREASKVGDLDAIQSSLAFLDRILPLHRMVEIYNKVRTRSPHREIEFRPTFERVFGERMSAFPTILPREKVIEALTACGCDEATALELMGEKHSDKGS
jgi:hypothetical protein